MSEYVNARINAPPAKVLSDKEDFQQRGRVLCDKGGFCATRKDFARIIFLSVHKKKVISLGKVMHC